MAIEFLKRSKAAAEIAADDAKTRATVESILADIEARGDGAVRALSEKFDNYSPQQFRLTDSEIKAAMNKVLPAIWKILNSPKNKSAALPKNNVLAWWILRLKPSPVSFLGIRISRCNRWVVMCPG